MTQTSKQIVLKDPNADFLALKQSSLDLAATCDKIVITDATSLQIAHQQYSLLKAKRKQVEDLRVSGQADALKHCQGVNALAKALDTPMKISYEAGEKKILAFNKAEFVKAQAEQNRINGIKSEISKYSAEATKEFDKCKTIEDLTAAREAWIIHFEQPATWVEFDTDYKNVRVVLNDYCKQKRMEIQTPAQVDETASEAIKEVLEEKVAEVGVQEVAQAGFTTTTKFRGLPRYRIVDEAAIPREWLMVDDSKVKAYQKANKDTLGNGEIVTGIEFYIEENVKI